MDLIEERMSEAELSSLIEMADADKDGRINYEGERTSHAVSMGGGTGGGGGRGDQFSPPQTFQRLTLCLSAWKRCMERIDFKWSSVLVPPIVGPWRRLWP